MEAVEDGPPRKETLMSRRSLQVLVLIVGFATLFPFATLSARPFGGSPGGQPPGLIASLWGDLVSLWSGAGCEVDSNGWCVSNHNGDSPARRGRGQGRGNLVSRRGAAGCEIDPSGQTVRNPGAGPTCGAATVGSAVAPGTR